MVLMLSAPYFGGLDTMWVDTVIPGLTLIHFLVIYIINRKRGGTKLFSFRHKSGFYSGSVFASVTNIVFLGIWGVVWLAQAGVDVYFAILSALNPVWDDIDDRWRALLAAKIGVQSFLSFVQSMIFWVLFTISLRYHKARKFTLPQNQDSDFQARRVESRHSDAATLIGTFKL